MLTMTRLFSIHAGDGNFPQSECLHLIKPLQDELSFDQEVLIVFENQFVHSILLPTFIM
jgi:hypothetical protein